MQGALRSLTRADLHLFAPALPQRNNDRTASPVTLERSSPANFNEQIIREIGVSAWRTMTARPRSPPALRSLHPDSQTSTLASYASSVATQAHAAPIAAPM